MMKQAEGSALSPDLLEEPEDLALPPCLAQEGEQLFLGMAGALECSSHRYELNLLLPPGFYFLFYIYMLYFYVHFMHYIWFY